MSLKITRAGIFDTVQDKGRRGFAHLGINPSGAMDRYAAQLANALLGKELQEPVIEIHFPASRILVQSATILCITGADFMPVLNGTAVPMHQPLAVAADTELSFGGLQNGSWAYLSCLGTLEVKPWLGSYSTNTRAGVGGIHGRRLQTGDIIGFHATTGPTKDPGALPFVVLPWKAAGLPALEAVGCIKGPEWGHMTRSSMTALEKEVFHISRQSDRMGYRLLSKVMHLRNNTPLLSSAVTVGTIQLLPDGQLIVLMADHQTTGGYPRIGHVITAHLPKLAQLPPGSEIRFDILDLEQAEALYFQQQSVLYSLQHDCAVRMKKFLS